MSQMPSTKAVTEREQALKAAYHRLWDACEALGEEISLEAIVSRGMDSLQELWGVGRFALFFVHITREGIELRAEPMSEFRADIKEVELDWLLILIKDLKHEHVLKEASEGMSLLRYQERSFEFAALGDPRFGAHILVWESTEHSCDHELELFVRQFQLNARWASRVAEAQNLLHIDDLTGLYNHRYMELSIDREIKRSQRYESAFCLLFIDLDHFKPINDQYGHLAGSQVLREVAQILRGAVRDVDLVFRYGGDEFVVLLIESDAKAGVKTGQRIRERIQNEPFLVQPGRIARVTASIGVAAFPEHATEKERLLTLADEGMYESKRKGKNQVILVGTPLSSSTSHSEEEGQKWSQK